MTRVLRQAWLLLILALLSTSCGPANHFFIENVASGNLTVVKLLLQLGVDPNTSDEHGTEALIRATWTGNLEMVRTLLSHGADVNASDYAGITSLESICDPTTVRTYQIEHGESPHVSSIVRELIDHGADVNHADQKGQTALYMAAGPAVSDKDENERRRILTLLLEKGADVNHRTVDRKTPLFAAAAAGDPDTVLDFIHHQAEVNASSALGDTPLMEAAGRWHRQTSEILLMNGADPNAVSRYGTALIQALIGPAGYIPPDEHGIEMVSILIGWGANVNLRDGTGRSPLETLASGMVVPARALQLAPLLLAKGAHLNARGPQGTTPLMLAAQSGNEPLIAFFLRNGANLNAKDDQGKRAEDWALKAGNTHTWQLLASLRGAHRNVG